MTQEITAAIAWTYENCSKYNGDPSQIFLMGHSAGGHLIALAVTNLKYVKDVSKVKGVILDDAAGLDMYTYFQTNPPTKKNDYLSTWTSSPEKWKDASPLYFVKEESPEFLIYVGEKTYPSIKSQNKSFVAAAKKYQPSLAPIYVNKNHPGMILQFINANSDRYTEILKFMDYTGKASKI